MAEQVQRAHNAHAAEPALVTVVCGAGHMGAVTAYVTRRCRRFGRLGHMRDRETGPQEAPGQLHNANAAPHGERLDVT